MTKDINTWPELIIGDKISFKPFAVAHDDNSPRCEGVVTKILHFSFLDVYVAHVPNIGNIKFNNLFVTDVKIIN